jgi:hypothetical protein
MQEESDIDDSVRSGSLEVHRFLKYLKMEVTLLYLSGCT